MKRDEGCKGCVWSFGKPDFICPLCEEYDLYFSWETGDKKYGCPVCHKELRKTENEPEYWLCDKCIKGFNREELKRNDEHAPVSMAIRNNCRKIGS